ncbi:hypothetical protein AMS68_004010 [Peltaster fructicola]|uniref:Sugar phosphate transporter domain-containing protein n=1 Tax=Peltaster fructicola TaxID=286661 RepID=A0A6H0XUT1_9PEZI|nr:hypothetical protein AMS68_004010 [Peltaster fructicola]
MQENIARKRASLLQKSSRWGDPAQKKGKKHRQRYPSQPGYDTSTDPTYPNVDIIHPHIPIMEDDLNTAPTGRRRSGSSPKRSGMNQHRRRRSTQLSQETALDEDHTSDSGLEDYLEQDDDEEAGLTHEERKRKRKWIWRNMRLDGRIAGDTSASKERSDTMWSADVIKTNAINALFIGLWYTFSIGISVYNTWMFSKGGLHFPFPLHDLCAYGDEDENSNEIERKPQIMTKWFYLTRIGPCGAATAMDIGLGNFSLRYISLTFYTMCKSSVLAFVLMFAFLFRLEKPSWKLGSIIGIMTVGVIMMVAGEADFQLTGFILIMSAALCSGFRWSITQILLLRNPATSNPFSSIFFLTPVMFVCLLVLALPIEGPVELVAGFRALAEQKGYLQGIAIMMAPGILAFMMVASEFALLQRTSVVTLSVCGIFKEVLTISTAARTFGDELSAINISGLFVTILAIAAYNYLKYLKMKEDFEKKTKGIAMKGSSSDASNDEEDFDTEHTSASPVDGPSRTNGALDAARVPRSEDKDKAR